MSKPTKYEYSSLILSTIAIGIGIWAIYSQEKIAKKSGAFDKSNITLTLGNYTINESIDYNVYYGIPILQKNINLVSLPITVNNTGEKSAENVEIYYKYPYESGLLIDQENLDIESFNKDIQRSTINTPPFAQASIKFKLINPNTSINANDIINIQDETSIYVETPVKTKDNRNINLLTYAKYSIITQVSLTAKDIKAKGYRFNISIVSQDNLNHIVKNIVTDQNTTKFLKDFFVIIPNNNQKQNFQKEGVIMNQYKSENIYFFRYDSTGKKIALLNELGLQENIFDVGKIVSGNEIIN
jgi:hypothetical protein